MSADLDALIALKRFTQWCAFTHKHGLNESPVGELVLWTSHHEAVEALTNTIADLRRQVTEKDADIEDLQMRLDAAQEHSLLERIRAEAAEQRLRQAQAETWEQAASLVDGLEDGSDHAILALSAKFKRRARAAREGP